MTEAHRRTGKRGPYEKYHGCLCEWCNEHFDSNHQNATTCSQACRSRRARFKKLTGFYPDEPPGPVTAQFAFMLLVNELLRLERIRREGVKRIAEQPYHNRTALERDLDQEIEQRRRTGR